MKQNFKFLKECYQLLCMIHKLDRSMVPSTLFAAFIVSIEPFVLIIGGAMVLDSLIAQQWELAFTQAAIMLVASLALGLLHCVLQRKRETAGMKLNRLCNNEICLKAISLDYETFEDKKNLEEFEAADYNVMRNGGFGAYTLAFLKAMQGFFGFLIALVFLTMLCLDTVEHPARFAFLVSQGGSFLVITIVILLLIFVYSKISSYVNKNTLQVFYENVSIEQKLEYYDSQLCNNANFAKEIRMFHMSDMLYRHWKHMQIDKNQFLKKKWRFETTSLQVYSLVNDTILLLSYLFVVIKTVAGAVTIGSFTRYVGSIQQMNASLKLLVENLNQMKLYQSYLSFYIQFLDKKNKMETGSLPVEKRNDHQYEVEFHDVSFKYPGSDTYTLRHVSMKLDMKNKFALVGRNGAGKTTFIKLLCRLYDVTEGMITLNGVDIRKYDYQEYMNLFGAVFQDFSLFAFPIKDNIACSQQVDETQMWADLDSVGLTSRIQKLDKKLDTLLYHRMGEGIDLSGGEAQKLAISRALYKDAPFVILDEPTAALDPISEYEIYSHFNDMVKDKTSIYISHRMSSCRFCDDILVFDQGELIQRGNHDVLMIDDQNVYAKLWNAQAKYYANDKDMKEMEALL